MNVLKVMPLLCLALVIDALQFLVGLSLTILGAMPGTAAGCVAGSAAAGGVGCALGGFLGSILNIAAPITVPLGVGLAFAISMCLSLTLGTILVMFLQYAGMLRKVGAIGAYIGETLPGFGALPVWTGFTIYCAWKSTRQKAAQTAVSTAASVVTGRAPTQINTRPLAPSPARTTVDAQPEYSGQNEEGEERTQETPSPRGLPMQDVKIRTPRADNDNVSQTYAKAA
jgi:hypothetical protein